jgi:hypothetical protein
MMARFNRIRSRVLDKSSAKWQRSILFHLFHQWKAYAKRRKFLMRKVKVLISIHMHPIPYIRMHVTLVSHPHELCVRISSSPRNVTTPPHPTSTALPSLQRILRGEDPSLRDLFVAWRETIRSEKKMRLLVESQQQIANQAETEISRLEQQACITVLDICACRYGCIASQNCLRRMCGH